MMKIYDLDISYGTQVKPQASPYCSTIEELVDVMQNAGLDGALIRCTDTDIVSTQTGNARLARDLRIAKAKGLDVWGLWALLPSCTDETPKPKDIYAAMKEDGIGALYVNPQDHQFCAHPGAMGDYYAVAEEKKIPMVFSTLHGLTPDQMHDILRAFPKLHCIIRFAGHWPKGRMLYPFLENYENTCLDTGYRWDDLGVEDIVRRYGAHRLLMSSSYPNHYIGASMAHVRCAEITPEQMELIFSGNLLRMLKEADLA